MSYVGSRIGIWSSYAGHADSPRPATEKTGRRRKRAAVKKGRTYAAGDTGHTNRSDPIRGGAYENYTAFSCSTNVSGTCGLSAGSRNVLSPCSSWRHGR